MPALLFKVLRTMMMMKNFNKLPDDCIFSILALSSPRDVCRSAAACSELRRAAESDLVWESFLPPDYNEIVSRAYASSMNFSSKKELFLVLCNSLHIDGGNKIFILDRISGLKSYILSARELAIAWADNPLYWSWKNVPASRFAETAELRTTYWLDIHGKIRINMLSPNTTYGAYLIFNISQRAYGLDTMPMEISIQVGDDQVCNNTVYLRQDYGKKQQIQWLLYYNRTEMLTSRVNQGLEGSVQVFPDSRDDGWMEIELGHFFTGESCTDDDREVKMSLMEIKGHHLKGGLVIEGIEIRPLNLFS